MKKLPKLAIVSTYDELCGIASYTRVLVKQLEPHFEIQVFDLDQFIFRHESKKVRKIADQVIDNICEELKNYDAVNIQLEHGTFGKIKSDACNRILKICSSSPKLAITFHTMIQTESLNYKFIFKNLMKANIASVVAHIGAVKDSNLLSSNMYKTFKKIQKNKPLSLIVHNRQNARLFKIVEGFDNVYDHPLAYFNEEEAQVISSNSELSNFVDINKIPMDSKILGCFGFLSPYKGFDVALEALKLLPNNYHLIIFGGIHPSSIEKNEQINAYLSDLIGQISPGKKIVDETASNNSLSLNLDANGLKESLLTPHPDDISKRVHFAGSLNDSDFPKAMCVCDAVLLPYIEVGQSASGPASMALNLNKRVIASRSKSFLQLSRYYPKNIEFFDIGNHLQLAQIIESKPLSSSVKSNIYGTDSNVNMYCKALFQQTSD